MEENNRTNRSNNTPTAQSNSAPNSPRTNNYSNQNPHYHSTFAKRTTDEENNNNANTQRGFRSQSNVAFLPQSSPINWASNTPLPNSPRSKLISSSSSTSSPNVTSTRYDTVTVDDDDSSSSSTSTSSSNNNNNTAMKKSQSTRGGRGYTIFLSKSEIIKTRLDTLKGLEKDSPELSVDLSKLQIQSYPSAISQYPLLTKLNLSSNSLVVLPGEIGVLVNLIELVLDNNELISLPKEIGKLTSLQRLHCYNNKITNLPSEISLLSSLQRLFLGKNQIGYFLSDLSSLSTSLQWLSLDENNLSSLPAEISNLSSLRWLSLESNQLHSLPREMGSMDALEFLSIVNNPNLLILPELFSQFRSLKDLRSDNLFLLPKHIADRHEGREILNYLVGIIARWDLNFNEKAHWELDQNQSKCAKCNSAFTFTKRRHHCRLCGLIFCNKDCDITCELPAITLPGRCCIDCYSLIDPLSPTNLYRQQQNGKQEKKMEKEMSRVIGFEDGDENLPLDEKIKKIKNQMKEVTDLVVLELNTKEGLIKMLSIVDGPQAEDTKRQICQSDDTLNRLNSSVKELRVILQDLTSD